MLSDMSPDTMGGMGMLFTLFQAPTLEYRRSMHNGMKCGQQEFPDS